MPAYQLQIKQVVDYPRCRIYRQFVHRLMADRSIRTSGGSGLFYFTVLCSYANFRTSYRRIDGISYTIYPGEWVCTLKEVSQWFRTRFQCQALTVLEQLQKQHFILGTTYRVNDIVIPADDSQVVWVKWHTPSTPQSVTITVSVSGAYTAQDTFVAEIVDLNEHIPPDPTATDTNPNYTVSSLPNEPQKLTANWGVWSCYWVPVWVWCDHDDWGHWVDEGYWEYEYTGYSASISGVMSLMPDDIVPTASGKSMKSGYGVKQDVTATLSTDAPTSHITHPQTAFSVFPEFQYETYLRLLQRVSSGRSAKFTFQPNEFSTYNRTVHFSPLWFPDSTDYTVFTQVWDTWTPDGMLSINLNDYVSIDGSLYDDWYTNRE